MSNGLSRTNMVARACDRLSLDHHVLQTLLLRTWGIVAGAATVALIPYGLTASEQGYYFTFSSVLALQVFFDLGLNQVIVLLVSHEAAYLQIQADGGLLGDGSRINRLLGLVGILHRWYASASLAFFTIVSVAGWIFFSQGSQSKGWLPIWCLLVAMTSFNLYLSPRLAIIEGTGKVGDVARLRLHHSLVGNLALWTLLLLHAGLWSTLAIPCSAAIITAIWLRTKAPWMTAQSTDSRFSWRREILPLQWRIGISWISGYLLFNLFTPIAFAVHGATEAGQIGLAVTIFATITTLGMSWVSARSPQFTMHIARGEYATLNALFKKSTIQAVMFTSLMAGSLIGIIQVANQYHVAIANRISKPNILIWLAVGAVCNTLVFSVATFMRAHREEPMTLPSVVVAVLTLTLVYLTRNNIAYMMMGNAAIITLVSLPWSLYLLRNYFERQR